MTSMVIADRSFHSELLRSLRRALPDTVRRLIQGPAERVVLADAPKGRRQRPFQPIDVVVNSDLVLRRRIIVPMKARKEVSHAINLFIQTETPFAPGEVLVHALEDAVRPSDHQVAYAVRLLPRKALQQALTAHKVEKRRIERVIVADAVEVDFAPALFPARRYTRWLPALPAVLIVASLVLLGADELSLRSQRVVELETEVAQTLGRVKALTADMEAMRQQASGTAAVLALLSETPSAFSALELVRQLLPTTSELLRVEIRGSETRLAVRSSNALADVQRLSGVPATWASSIEGAITADPTSGLEMATILLRPRIAGT